MAGSHLAGSLSSSIRSLFTSPIAIAAPAASRPRSSVATTNFMGFRPSIATVSLYSSSGSSGNVHPLDKKRQQRKEKRAVWALSSSEGAAPTAVEEKGLEPSEVAQLKRALVDSFYGTELGLKASSETRGEIVELITQLEAKNPTVAPTETLTLLDGKWILAYTSFSELFPLLAAGTVPLVKVEKISQTIDSANFMVENSVQLSGPLATTSLSTNAKFEIRSPKRVQIDKENQHLWLEEVGLR
ncbi:plastid-lipid-associated protein, chloroplastic isoform X2 [Nymphaea colorata]|uniref:plastid-lipid-associated protein, chloroplastic isoform X2 n=1 Tax=Nymphaea colorata TaxID=210225 RepID=UPI00214E4205|nr:plastid-lipid-associated protein, chloroplastic isoform X2 [Nymphaea colorata]